MILTLDNSAEFDKIFKRSRIDYENMRGSVKQIIENVKTRGDEALFDYTLKFDKVKLDEETVLVSEKEIDEAYKSVDEKTLSALRAAKDNIVKYNERQLRKSDIVTENGRTTGYIVKPVNRAGIYVPGGREFGVDKIFKVGGAQAIAAMAYGTAPIPKADVISGPGNIYVALAKREVYGEVGIDMVAGPSEILIVADDSANPEFVAADMLSQAEHDEMAMSILITPDRNLADRVKQ